MNAQSQPKTKYGNKLYCLIKIGVMEKNNSLLKIKTGVNQSSTILNIATVVDEKRRLCRCGKSKNKPYCSGSHAKSRI